MTGYTVVWIGVAVYLAGGLLLILGLVHGLGAVLAISVVGLALFGLGANLLQRSQ